MEIIETLIIALFALIIAVAPIPVTWSAIYLRNLSKEQNGKSWLLKMLAFGAKVKTVSVWLLALVALYSAGRALFSWEPLPRGWGTILLGSGLVGIEYITVYYAYVIRERRKNAVARELIDSTFTAEIALETSTEIDKRIVDIVENSVREFYALYPDRIGDNTVALATETTKEILNVIKEYDFNKKES